MPMPQRLLIHGISCKIGNVEQGTVPCSIKTVSQERNTDMVTLCKLFYTQIKIENMNMQ